jgi:3-phosphoshikimate 1-carboxyvinyltransferase
MPVASAQVKSAILLAGLYASGETTIREPAVSRDHTERMLETMGVQLHHGEGRITMPGGQQPLAWDVEVPADMSSATFAILATIISANGVATISNVGVNPTRTGVIEILRAMGAAIEVQNVRLLGQEPVADIHVSASRLHGIEVDPSLVSLAIDEFPALFIAAAAAEGKTYFSGIGELRVKESDRIGAMTRGLESLGVHVTESPETAVVTGGPLSGGTVQSHGDHRIAMSFAVAGSIASDPVIVLDTDAVKTSFPGFPEAMQLIGINIIQEDGVAA